MRIEIYADPDFESGEHDPQYLLSYESDCVPRRKEMIDIAGSPWTVEGVRYNPRFGVVHVQVTQDYVSDHILCLSWADHVISPPFELPSSFFCDIVPIVGDIFVFAKIDDAAIRQVALLRDLEQGDYVNHTKHYGAQVTARLHGVYLEDTGACDINEVELMLEPIPMDRLGNIRPRVVRPLN